MHILKFTPNTINETGKHHKNGHSEKQKHLTKYNINLLNCSDKYLHEYRYSDIIEMTYNGVTELKGICESFY